MAVMADRLTGTWATPRDLAGWLTTVDHKRIGARYMCTAFFFFLLAGLAAAAMRTQLAEPLNNVLSAERYNELFTMHGLSRKFDEAAPPMLVA